MKGYEFTERGKIAIAVIIAILMITLAVILAVRFLNGTPPLDNQPQASESGTADSPTDISNTPLPDGSGVDSNDPTNENGEHGSFDPQEELSEDPEEPTLDSSPEPADSAQEPSEEPPEDEQTQENPPGRQPATGSASINRSLGTMSFSFSPSGQDSLDSDTVAMLEDFIASPRNTASSQIVIEIPQLSGNETSTIKSVVIDAFAKQGVAQSSLEFITYRSSSTDGSHDVRLSFSYPSNRK